MKLRHGNTDINSCSCIHVFDTPELWGKRLLYQSMSITPHALLQEPAGSVPVRCHDHDIPESPQLQHLRSLGSLHQHSPFMNGLSLVLIHSVCPFEPPSLCGLRAVEEVTALSGQVAHSGRSTEPGCPIADADAVDAAGCSMRNRKFSTCMLLLSRAPPSTCA